MTHKYIIPSELSSEAQKQDQVDSFTFPYFFRPTSSVFPKGPNNNTRNIPFGLMITPGNLEDVPTVDYRNKYIVRCNMCHSYLSCNCAIIPERKAWACALCGSLSTLPKDYDIDKGVETHFSVYDMITNPSPNDNECQEFRKMYVIAIDQSKKEFCQHFSKSVKNSLLQMPDDSYVSLLSFDQSVTIHDPFRKKSITLSDFDNYIIPPLKYLPLKEAKSFFIKILDSLQDENQRKKVDTSPNFTNVLKIGKNILKENGGIFILSLFGRPTDIANSTINYSFIIPENQSDIINNGFSMNSSSISLHIFHQESGISGCVITDTIAGLTCGASYSSQTDVEPHLIRTLTQNYCWQGIGVLRTNPNINIKGFLGNCVVRKNGVCTFGAFPQTAAMSYELGFLSQQKTLNEKNIGIQFAFNFRRMNDGVQISRIISFLVSVGDGFEAKIDQAVLTAVVAKIGVKKMRDQDFEKGCNFVNEFATFGKLNQTDLFKDSINISIDSKMIDSVFIYGANLTEIMLYAAPKEERGTSSLWRLSCKEIYVFADEGKRDDVRKTLFGEEENDEKRRFMSFCEDAKNIMGRNMPIVMC